MAARTFDGLGVSEIPLKVPLKGTDFGRAMQQLMQGEANAKDILAAANELQQRRDRLAGIETLSEMTVDEALELMLAYDRQLEDLQGRLEVRLPECPTHTHTYLWCVMWHVMHPSIPAGRRGGARPGLQVARRVEAQEE